MNKYIFPTVLTSFLVSACTQNGPLFHSWSEYESERTENGIYLVEEPYQVKDVWYFPAEQYNYSEKGLASWYMPAGDSALTANGEVYDVNIASARHKTLPLPSMVRVTNLENGKSVVARVNDRGPMVNNRLIDVSQAAARALEMPATGTVLVQVDVLAEESQELKEDLLKQGRMYQTNTTAPVVIASAEPEPLDLFQPQPAVETEPVVYNGTPKTEAPKKVVAVAPMKGNTVVLGTFGVPQNAQRLQEKLVTKFPVRIETVQKNGRSLSVVKSGPYPTSAEAKDMLQQFKALGYTDAYIAK